MRPRWCEWGSLAVEAAGYRSEVQTDLKICNENSKQLKTNIIFSGKWPL